MENKNLFLIFSFLLQFCNKINLIFFINLFEKTYIVFPDINKSSRHELLKLPQVSDSKIQPDTDTWHKAPTNVPVPGPVPKNKASTDLPATVKNKLLTFTNLTVPDPRFHLSSSDNYLLPGSYQLKLNWLLAEAVLDIVHQLAR